MVVRGVGKQDEYIRLTTSAFRKLLFHQFNSSTNSDFLEELIGAGIQTDVAGLAQLSSSTHVPAVIEFGWYLHSRTRNLHLAPGFVGTNVVLIDKFGRSISSRRTSKFLLKWLKSTKWKRTMRQLHAEPRLPHQVAGIVNRQWRKDYQVKAREITSADELFKLILRKANDLGFEFASYGIKTPIPLTTPKALIFNNYPQEWKDRYDSAGYLLIDPTVKHAISSNAQIIWSDDLFKAAPEFWKEAQSHGLNVGWAKAMRDAHGLVGLFTLCRRSPGISQQELDANEDHMIWLTERAHTDMARILIKELAPIIEGGLSEAEKIALRWSGEGKTISEIAQITGVSERSLKFSLENVREKFNTPNTAHAVLMAFALGLLN